MHTIINTWVAFALVWYAAAVAVLHESNPYIEALKKNPWESVQAYVEVRPGAFMFYWLYYADGTRAGAAEKPLVIWIQGGPGYAATGIGNFLEIGPLDVDLQPRNHTWVKGRNLLLIDHPVGTGFSYVTNESLHAKTDDMIVDDLVKAIQGFFKTRKEFRETPSYLFSQSYGAKLCPKVAYYLHKAIEKKTLNMNLKGLGLGSSLVNTQEFAMITPRFLFNVGLLDQTTYLKLVPISKKIGYFIDREDYKAAAELINMLTMLIISESGQNINRLNVNQEDDGVKFIKLDLLVDKYVKPTLMMVNQSFHWSYQISDEMFNSYVAEMVIPTTKFLEMLLNETRLNIALYNGNLDSLCAASGVSIWVHKLKWPGADEFRVAKRVPINGQRNGFYKKAKQLSFWTVFGAGHWVPVDNPVAMEHILEYVISSTS